MRIKAVCRLRGKSAEGRAALPFLGKLGGAARGISRLRARPKGAALWNPAAFVKAGETFDCASRSLTKNAVRRERTMRILGIDPGFATIGFGLVEAERGQARMVTYGAITTPAGLPLSRRLYQIGTDMEDLIAQLKPDVISIEELFFNTNITTGIAVAHGRGVLLYAAEKCGVPLYEYTPSQVKLAVAGYGRAEKRQVMDMTRRLLKLQKVPRPDDAADALALALCHARSFTSRLPKEAGVKETV